MRVFEQQFIGGHWRYTGGSVLVLHNPATELPAATVRLGTAADADDAVAAAVGVLPVWSATPIQERAAILARAGKILAAQGDSLAESFAAEIGTPISSSRRLQVDLAVR